MSTTPKRVTRRWAPVLALLVTVPAPAAEPPTDDPATRAMELRIANDWPAALVVTEEWVERLEADPSVPAHERASARAALVVVRRALELPAEGRAALSQADAMTASIDDHDASGEFEQVAEESRTQREIRVRWLGEDVVDVASGLTNEAVARTHLGQLDEAVPLYERALLSWAATVGTEHPEYAKCLSSLAGLRLEQGELDDAKNMLARAIRIREEAFGPNTPEISGSLNNLAYVFYRNGEYDQAVSLLRKALVLEQAKANESLAVARALENLGAGLSKQGNPYAADELFAQAHRMRATIVGEAHIQNAIALNNRASLNLTLGDLEQAEALLRESLDLFRQLGQGDHPRAAAPRRNLGRVLLERGEYVEARRVYGEALAIMESQSGETSPYYASSLHGLGHVQEREGELDAARASYEHAYEIRRRLFGRTHADLVESWKALARIAYREGRLEVARDCARTAAETFEVARLRSGDALARSTFQSSPYLLLAAIEQESGDADAAWAALDRASGRALEDLLAEHRASLTSEEAARQRELRNALLGVENRILAREQADQPGEADGEAGSASLRIELERLEFEWSELHRSVQDRLATAQGRSRVPSREGVQGALDSDEALVAWLEIAEPERPIFAYVLRDRGEPVWVELGSGPSSELIAEYRRALCVPRFGRERADRVSRELHAACFAPLLPYLSGVRNLVVVSSGPLSGAPIEALLDPEGEPLGARYAVTHSPSAAVHFWLTDRASPADDDTPSALLVGDPSLRADPSGTPDVTPMESGTRGGVDRVRDLPSLPEARKEITALAALIDETELLVGADASEQALVQRGDSRALADFDVLHFATHAIVDPRRPTRSRLVLSQLDLPDPYRSTLEGRRIFDGFLSVSEILGEWDLDADLVTLSACESGLGRRVEGEGYFGFAHALFAVGARSLLVSQWPVHDVSTRLLMERFYENWSGRYRGDRGQGVSAAMSRREALREARSWLRAFEDETGNRPYASPYHWASFVLVGDGR